MVYDFVDYRVGSGKWMNSNHAIFSKKKFRGVKDKALVFNKMVARSYRTVIIVPDVSDVIVFAYVHTLVK